MRGTNQTIACQFVCLFSLILLATVPHGASEPAEGNYQGLWVGEIHLNKVATLTGDNPGEMQPTADSAFIRVILHANGADETRLLSHVVLARISGVENSLDSKELLFTDEEKLSNLYDSIKKSDKRLVARRIETVSYDLPRKNPPPDPLPSKFDPSRLEQDYESEHLLAGKVGPGETVRTRKGTLVLDPWHRSNPFRHAYHQDHTTGYRILREMEFTFDPASSDRDKFQGNYGVDILTGIYRESIEGLVKPGEKVTMSGSFTLKRISLADKLNR